eukprot:1176104-Prorocentrum_minimum.AAC.6
MENRYGEPEPMGRYAGVPAEDCEEITIATEEESRELQQKKKDVEEQRRLCRALTDPMHEEAYPASSFLSQVKGQSKTSIPFRKP